MHLPWKLLHSDDGTYKLAITPLCTMSGAKHLNKMLLKIISIFFVCHPHPSQQIFKCTKIITSTSCWMGLLDSRADWINTGRKWHCQLLGNLANLWCCGDALRTLRIRSVCVARIAEMCLLPLILLIWLINESLQISRLIIVSLKQLFIILFSKTIYTSVLV